MRSQEMLDLLEEIKEAVSDGEGKGKLSDKVIALKKQIVDLEIEKSKLTEAHEREKREVTHMVGLEKKRQEFEIEQAKRETTVGVREENLAADRKRFDEQMKFTTDRFQAEVGYLKDLMGQVLDRLPNVSANFKTGAKAS